MEQPAQIAPALMPVRAGSYALRLSATCDRRELNASGVLTLRRIAGEGSAANADEEAAVLLWGQTDLNFEQLKSCFGGAIPSAQEPIHPSVLVEVLKWDGEPRHPVLLVSAEGRAQGGAKRLGGIGIAMWVERSDQDHLGGIWSRWELIGREEGRWDADLLTPQ